MSKTYRLSSINKVLALSLLLCQTAMAEDPPKFEQRTYCLRSEIDEISATWSKANRTLFCRGLDDILDSYRPRNSKSWQSRRDADGMQISLTRQAITAIPFDQQDKELLVISLSGAAIGKSEEQSEVNLRQLEPFLNQLGYKRVLVMCATHLPEGIRIMRDMRR